MTQIDKPNLDKCDCICHSPAFYAPHKTGHACCDDANVIEDNSLLVRTTNIAEPNLDEQIDEIIEKMWDFSPFQDEDSRIGRVHKELKALIATQIQEARLDELYEAIDVPIANLPSYLADRIAQLRSTPND